MCNWHRHSFSMGCFAGKSRLGKGCNALGTSLWGFNQDLACGHAALEIHRKSTVLIGSDRFLIFLLRYLSQQPALIHESPICIDFTSGGGSIEGTYVCVKR